VKFVDRSGPNHANACAAISPSAGSGSSQTERAIPGVDDEHRIDLAGFVKELCGVDHLIGLAGADAIEDREDARHTRPRADSSARTRVPARRLADDRTAATCNVSNSVRSQAEDRLNAGTPDDDCEQTTRRCDARAER
jgi:hypothetical protein